MNLVNELRTGLKLAFDSSLKTNTVAAAYDGEARKVDFQVGDSVFINRPDNSQGLFSKLKPRWMGLYLICLVMGDEIMVQPEGKRGVTRWVHVNQCKMYRERVVIPQEQWPEASGFLEEESETGAEIPEGINHQVSLTPVREPEESGESVRSNYNLRSRVPVYYGP